MLQGLEREVLGPLIWIPSTAHAVHTAGQRNFETFVLDQCQLFSFGNPVLYRSATSKRDVTYKCAPVSGVHERKINRAKHDPCRRSLPHRASLHIPRSVQPANITSCKTRPSPPPAASTKISTIDLSPNEIHEFIALLIPPQEFES
jgi:hypothetical protein